MLFALNVRWGHLIQGFHSHWKIFFSDTNSEPLSNGRYTLMKTIEPFWRLLSCTTVQESRRANGFCVSEWVGWPRFGYTGYTGYIGVGEALESSPTPVLVGLCHWGSSS